MPSVRTLRVRRQAPAQVNVSSRVIRGNVRRADTSRQVDDDDVFANSGLGGTILQTPYELSRLSLIFEQSNALNQCVDAMVTNVVKYGYRIVAIDEKTPMDEAEQAILQSFIDSANTEETLVAVQSKKVHDYEKYGHGYLEVIRDAKGNVTLLRHAKAFNIRLMAKSTDTVEVTTNILRGGRRAKVVENCRFRRYVQIVNSTKVYYKEFGDPRVMDYRTGDYASESNIIPVQFRATELLHERQYSEDSYGVPRWISQLPSILGSREAEEVNLRYFEDNTVPPMILSVAGGRLTRQSFTDLTKLLKQKGVGKDRQNQILLIEAIPETSGLDDKGTVSLRVDKLTDARPSDGLFRDYDNANISKVRSAFRLPPMLIGLSQDVTFATANVSAYLAETQVFLPERQGHDEFLNKKLVNSTAGLGLRTVRLESKGPSVTNPDQIVKTMTALNVMGGVTPRRAIHIINETMQLSIDQYPEKEEEGYEEWMDMPMLIAQKVYASKTQQTGESTNDPDGTKTKTPKVKETEETGSTGVESQSVEHGSE